MDAMLPDSVRAQHPISRLFRRVRWILLLAYLVGFISLAVWSATSSGLQFEQKRPVIGGASIVLGGLLMVAFGLSLIGRWKPGHQIEFWLKKSPWFFLFFLALEQVLQGVFFFTHPALDTLLLWALLPAGALLLGVIANMVLSGIFLNQKEKQRAAGVAFLALRAQHRFDPETNLEPGASDGLVTSSTWVSQGQYWLKEQNYVEALRAFDQAINLDPRSAQAYLGQGMALSRLGAWAEALTAYEQAWELDTSLVEALAGQASMHTGLGRPEEGLTLAQEAIRMDPIRSLSYVTKGTALLRLQHYRAAFRSYWEAWRVSRHTARSHTGSAA